MTPQTYDIVILGSGAAGLGAAVTAAAHGAQVLVLEKAGVLGGTTAWSGGWIWAPNTSLARSAGIDTAPDAPRQYLQHVLGNHFTPERVDAFLDGAPKMVEFFHSRTALQFDLGAGIPDTYSHLPGAGLGGRSVIARPYDARALKGDITALRLPLAQTTFHGMTIQAGPDLRSFMTMTRNARSFAHVTGRVLRHARDLAVHGRGMDLRNGAALAGRLMQSARELGVAWRMNTRVAALLQGGGGVNGVQLACGQIIHARRGVILATGGYGHDATLRAATFPRNDSHCSLSVPTATGDGVALATAVGAQFDTRAAAPAAYCPVSTVPCPDGTYHVFPHIIDRGKPGVIGVLANGARFCNEGLGYHDYVTALLGATPPDHPPQSWLVCDHRFLRRYGLGIVRPAPVPWRQWRRRGYLKTANTLADLAHACGMDAAGLARTVADWNTHASAGHDPAFGRGTTPYMRLQGDPDHGPNPCVAPVVKPPFHAVRVTPGSFGTFAGLACDGAARVLDHAGAPISGLYCAGADAASPFGGFYPAGGINLGPALTFGFIAGHHAATGNRP
ncbi:FAD-dependent oxidoreductase [Roseinatronobacter sp. NSM]|uniref:FAD-dependent oxidoreductase n=1 Tax=Roseinatronobacter sp. NSM TaxID=3457785 RepID=UPI004036E2DB